MKILDAKAAVDKEWKKVETVPAWQLEKVKSKKEVLEPHGHMPPEKTWSQNQNYTNTKAESCSVVTL